MIGWWMIGNGRPTLESYRTGASAGRGAPSSITDEGGCAPCGLQSTANPTGVGSASRAADDAAPRNMDVRGAATEDAKR